MDVELRRRDGGVARVIVTHLGLSPRERTLQARHLRGLLDGGRDAPVILMGDFNQWFPFWGSLKPLVRWFGAAPYRRTFPSWLPGVPAGPGVGAPGGPPAGAAGGEDPPGAHRLGPPARARGGGGVGNGKGPHATAPAANCRTA